MPDQIQTTSNGSYQSLQDTSTDNISGARPDFIPDSPAPAPSRRLARPDFIPDSSPSQTTDPNSIFQNLPTQPQPPGFFRRLGESLGLPTSTQQLQAISKDAVSPRGIASAVFGPIVDVVPGVFGYAQRVYNNVGSDLRDEYEGARDIVQGGPIGANFGKIGYGIAHGGVANLPFVGEPAESISRDIPTGNYAGAAGSAVGIAAQIALPEAIKKVYGRLTATPTTPIETPTPAAPVAPAYAPDTPADLVGKAGLVYKGELVPGANVHMFEDAAYPGKTAALNTSEMTSPARIREAMNTKLAAFGVDPASLPSSIPSPESFAAPTDTAPTAIPGTLPLKQPSLVQRAFEKWSDVRAHDPEIGDMLQQADNARQFYSANGQNIVDNVLGKGAASLTTDQEHSFMLLADKQSRAEFQANRPDEYQAAINDPAIQGALDRYKPYEQELTAVREANGGKTYDGDYIRRVYAENTDDRISGGQRRIGIQSQNALPSGPRIASAENFYQTGLHEFEPAFAPKYVGENLRQIQNQLIENFESKATKLERGEPTPATINYQGREYTAPDVSTAKPFGRPNDYMKFDTENGTYLGPKTVVKALRNYDPMRMEEPGLIATKANPIRDWQQRQVLMTGAGIPHGLNIVRRIANSPELGMFDPRGSGWADAAKVLFNKELKARALNGMNDPTFNSLMKNGGLTSKEVTALKQYWLGNFDPRTWAEWLLRKGHENLFGPGGLDTQARITVYDRIHANRPDLSPAAIVREVNTTLGNYNRTNWTGTQKGLSYFTYFPAWDTTSMQYVLQHPIKSVVPGAVINLVANQTLSRLGKQNDPKDATDPFAIHYGNNAFSSPLTREPMAIHLMRPLWAAAQEARNPGANVFSVARVGLQQGIREGLKILPPYMSGLVALGTSAAGLDVPGVTVFNKKDTQTPGVFLLNKALEKVALYTILKTNPLADRMVNGDTSQLEQKLRMYNDALHGDSDARKQIGENMFYGSAGTIGVYDYRRDAEETLARRASMSNMFNENINRLAKGDQKDQEQAAKWVTDPTIASYLTLRPDFNYYSKQLKQLDTDYDNAKTANERKAIEEQRKTILALSETTDDAFMHTKSNNAVEKAKAADAAASSDKRPDFIPDQAPSGQDKKADFSSAPRRSTRPDFIPDAPQVKRIYQPGSKTIEAL